MNIKTLFQADDERAVSPVIGVILMVAITVILAAVIGAFVLDLGSSVEAEAQAGVSVSDESASTPDVTVNSLGDNTDGVYCSNGADSSPGTGSGDLAGVGDTIEGCDGNVIGVTESGSETVVRNL